MWNKFVKFEAGVLVGTLIGAVVSALVCTMAFNAFGYDSSDIILIKDCLEEEINERMQVPGTQ